MSVHDPYRSSIKHMGSFLHYACENKSDLLVRLVVFVIFSLFVELQFQQRSQVE
jgi:hypothetical protein